MENFIKCKVKNCKGNAHFKSNGKNNYKNTSDKKRGIPPLFRYELNIFDIDTERIDEIEGGEILFSMK